MANYAVRTRHTTEVAPVINLYSPEPLTYEFLDMMRFYKITHGSTSNLCVLPNPLDPLPTTILNLQYDGNSENKLLSCCQFSEFPLSKYLVVPVNLKFVVPKCRAATRQRSYMIRAIRI